MPIKPTPADRIINLGIAFVATIAFIGVAVTIARMAIWIYDAIAR
jgi:hypothetical protein